MKLSILICSLSERFKNLSALVSLLQNQVNNKPIEILWLGDNRKMTVGEKRNKLLQLAKGEYVCFIDDDDMISDNYVEELLAAMRTNPDVICFECLYENAETGIKNHVFFGKEHLNINRDDKGFRYRMPNHLCALKREIALKAKFNEKNFGEDYDFAIALRNKFLLHSEVVISQILYYYNFNPKTSATWQFAPVNQANALHHQIGHNAPIKMDMVIVSDGTMPELQTLTNDCVKSCQWSVAGGQYDANIIIMEKSEKVIYPGADTFSQKTPFNYNRCLNEGAMKGNAEYICFSNNDIGFCDGFLMKAIQEMKAKGLDVGGVKDHRGYEPRNCITGWCFIMRRDAWAKIGKLNEDYTFYCSDNIVWMQIKQHHLKYAVLQNVYCYHNISATKNKLDMVTKEEYTTACVKKFNRQYHENLLNIGN